MRRFIAAALKGAFGFSVLRDGVGRAPCFILPPPERVESSPFSPGRTRRDLTFTLRYYAAPRQQAADVFDGRDGAPDGDEAPLGAVDGDLIDTGDRLFSVLVTVDTPDGPVRGRNMSYKIKDGAVHFTVTYTLILTERKPRKSTMKEMTYSYGIGRRDLQRPE